MGLTGRNVPPNLSTLTTKTAHFSQKIENVDIVDMGTKQSDHEPVCLKVDRVDMTTHVNMGTQTSQTYQPVEQTGHDQTKGNLDSEKNGEKK